MRHPYLPAVLLAACLGLCGPAQAAEPCSNVAADLAAMTSADQALRKRLNFLEVESPAQVKLRSHLTLVDRTNTQRLKTLIAQCGWPSKATHGSKAAGDAWLLAQHADRDIAFQKQVLVLIEQAAAASGEGVDSSFAYLEDRIAVAEGRPQRYGTQLMSRTPDRCELDFSPMDDREKVEARRAKLGMPPLAVYKRLVIDMPHCPGDSPAVMLDGVHRSSTKDHHYGPPAAESQPKG
jgi:hypothetical protein